MASNKEHLKHVQVLTQETAEHILSRNQLLFVVLFGIIIALSVFQFGIIIGQITITVITLFFAAIVYLKIFLMIYALWLDEKKIDEVTLPSQLPIVTILGPHYKEGAVVARWVRNIEKIDYPQDKLEVLLLIRRDDFDTLSGLEEVRRPVNFRIIWLDEKDYGSKPAALNVGLDQAKGTFVAIYDSENGPAPDQIKKQVAALCSSPEYVVAAQSVPVVSNWKTKHWWQKVFPKIEAAEYSSYYSLVNRALLSLGLLTPLPGNSIMFRKDALMAVGKYDRYNKTEDADIAVRLARRGWKVVFVQSETTEESPTSYKDWEGRRRRWTHGFMQTWLVPMRNPIRLWKDLGTANFAMFHLIIGGSTFVQLVNPILWLMTILYWTTGSEFIKELYPWPVLYLAVTTTIVGVFLVTFYSMIIGVLRREMYSNIFLPYFALIYNLFISFAAYRAVWDLLMKAEWHKTSHVVEEELIPITAFNSASRDAAG